MLQEYIFRHTAKKQHKTNVAYSARSINFDKSWVNLIDYAVPVVFLASLNDDSVSLGLVMVSKTSFIFLEIPQK